MKSSPRRLPVLLSALFAALLWMSGSTDIVTAARQGVYLTPNGFRTPLYGMSLAQDANGVVGTSCAQVTQPQIEAARFGRRLSRSMMKISPQAVVDTGAGVKFNITYSDPQGTGFNDSAVGDMRRRALEAAAAAWSRVIRGAVTINIDAVMKAPDKAETEAGNILLAVAGPADFWLVGESAVPSSLAWQLQGSRNPGEDVDITVIVNPDINWEYATNGVSGGDRVSFVYTLIHEIAHGLGFVDSFDPETGTLLNDPVPFIYDTFVNRGSDTRRRVMSRPAHEVKDDVKSRDLYFGGEAAIEASQRSIRPLPMIRLYAPDPYEQGSSVSHVDQDTYADFRTGVMTPRDFGGGRDTIDTLTLSVMKDLGYQLVPNATTSSRVR
ncbi:MAG TPA: hypothetical protein VEA16_14155 [Vicinamibacterales bacterium]|nr:hypothetical protein [Vicinamibacterales bacterium]